MWTVLDFNLFPHSLTERTKGGAESLPPLTEQPRQDCAVPLSLVEPGGRQDCAGPLSLVEAWREEETPAPLRRYNPTESPGSR